MDPVDVAVEGLHEWLLIVTERWGITRETAAGVLMGAVLHTYVHSGKSKEEFMEDMDRVWDAGTLWGDEQQRNAPS